MAPSKVSFELTFAFIRNFSFLEMMTPVNVTLQIITSICSVIKGSKSSTSVNRQCFNLV